MAAPIERVGELPVCFARIHEFEKCIEGSGLDLICTEIGLRLHSPATVRQNFGAENCTRGIELCERQILLLKNSHSCTVLCK